MVFDTETTGLDTKTDDVVQMAGVRILRNHILVEDEFETLVAPRRKIPPSSTKIHGITDDMVIGAPHFPEAVRGFLDYVDDAVVVAHNAGFDMAFVNREAGEACQNHNDRVLCTAQLSQALDPQINDHTLDAIALRYGVEIDEARRHTALGDAYMTAKVFQKMLPMLEDREITTLEHVLEFQGTR